MARTLFNENRGHKKALAFVCLFAPMIFLFSNMPAVAAEAEATQDPLSCARYLVLQTTQTAGASMPLAHLALRYAGAGRIDEARELADRLEHPDIKVRTLSAIAGELIERHQNETALELLEEARKAARWLGSSPFELNELLGLARRFHDAGSTERSEQLLAMALETAQKPAPPFSQAELLVEIAAAHTALGNEIFASTILTRAFNLATKIDDQLFRSTVLGRIAEGYGACGQNTLSQLTLAETLRAAQTAKSKAAMAEALAEAAVSYAAGGKHERAFELLKKAAAIAEGDTAEFSSQGALLAIGEAYLDIGNLERALEIAREIDYFSYLDARRVFIQEIAERFARDGHCERAFELVKSEDIMTPDAVLYRIAVSFAARDRLDRAYAITRSVEDAYFSAKILEEIGSRLAETGQITKAGGFFLGALGKLTAVSQTETGRLYRITTLADIGLGYARFRIPIGADVRKILHTLITEAEKTPEIIKPPGPQAPPSPGTLKIKMIIGDESFKQAGIEYQDRYYTLGIGDEIKQRYRIVDIEEFSIKVLDLKTNQEQFITIEPF